MGDKQAVLKRYNSGNPVSEDGLFIPIDPASQGSVCSTSVVTTLRRELGDPRGSPAREPKPCEEKAGLLDAGDKLGKKLKQIGSATP